MDRIKNLSYKVLAEHHSKFSEDFADNKKVLNQISIIRSKGLKNEIAGYITKYIKKQIREENAKREQSTQNVTNEVEYADYEDTSIVDESVDEVTGNTDTVEEFDLDNNEEKSE